MEDNLGASGWMMTDDEARALEIAAAEIAP
jgi:hypothetical protein